MQTGLLYLEQCGKSGMLDNGNFDTKTLGTPYCSSQVELCERCNAVQFDLTLDPCSVYCSELSILQAVQSVHCMY